MRSASCILYFVGYQKCTDKQSILTTLTAIARSLLVNQTLVVEVSVNAKDGETHAVKHMAEFHHNLSGSKDSPISSHFNELVTVVPVRGRILLPELDEDI